MRRWSVRHARSLESVWSWLEPALTSLHPLWAHVGYERLEGPVAWLEKLLKGFLFDCRMCGHCVLSSTGMSCPMNCPKQLRNGPCGGVRADGNCEVRPQMRCVWLEAAQGSRRMREGRSIMDVQFAVDARAEGTSSWLRVARESAERAALAHTEPGP